MHLDVNILCHWDDGRKKGNPHIENTIYNILYTFFLLPTYLMIPRLSYKMKKRVSQNTWINSIVILFEQLIVRAITYKFTGMTRSWMSLASSMRFELFNITHMFNTIQVYQHKQSYTVLVLTHFYLSPLRSSHSNSKLKKIIIKFSSNEFK